MDALSEDTSGSYDGLGLEVITVDGAMRVVAPIDDTPADRGGIKAGDIIVRIDGKPITQENVNGIRESCCAARPAPPSR